jgi:hypothetical protein
MLDGIDEACEVVQAAAAGKGKAAIRRMLTEEFRSRDVELPPDLFDVLVKQIAAGTYAPGEPLVSVHRSGLLRVPFIRKAIGRMLEPALEELSEQGVMGGGVVWVTEHLADAWPVVSRTLPHPPGLDLYAPGPDEVPPPARLVPAPDLRERMPDLFEAPAPPLPPRWPGMPSPTQAELVFVWLEDSGGAVAVCCQPGRIGILNAEDTEAYLPLVRSAHAQGKVVAATADIRFTARGLLPATVRVVSGRSGPGGCPDEFPDDAHHGLDLRGGRGSRGLAGRAAGRAGVSAPVPGGGASVPPRPPARSGSGAYRAGNGGASAWQTVPAGGRAPVVR